MTKLCKMCDRFVVQPCCGYARPGCPEYGRKIKKSGDSRPTVDWTKPIRFAGNTAFSETSVELVTRGKAQVCVKSQHGYLYLLNPGTGRCDDANVLDLYVENIPKPKTERWYRIYLGPAGSAYSFGDYGSMEIANAAHIKADLDYQYLGAVLLRNKL